MSIKQCSKCGTTFQCSNEQMGCWCEDVFLDIETLNKLKSEYNNCLCPPCLKGYENIAAVDTNINKHA